MTLRHNSRVLIIRPATLRISTRLTAAILLGLPLYSQQGSQNIRVGLPGGWTLNSRPLKAGATYSALSEFEGTKDAGDLLLECGAGGTLAYTCLEERCVVPACTTSSKGVTVHIIHHPEVAGSSMPSVVGMLTSLFRREPVPVSVLGVRGVGDPNDGVLLKDGDAVHWGPALKGVSEGGYCLQLRPLPQTSSEAIVTVNLDWDRTSDAEGIGKAASVVPGLHLLAKGTPGLEGSCTLSSEQTPAWVLIAGEPRFSRLSKAWKDYAPELKELNQSGNSAALQATIRHAALAYLSDSQ